MTSRPFIVLGMSMFLATLGLGMVTPILPVYAKSLGATGAQVGLTFSAFAITQLFISPWSGRIADRFGRKPFLLLGLVTYFVTAIGWLFANSIEVVIAFRALSGVGSALIFSMAAAYVGDLAPRGFEGRYMGAFGVFDFLGFGFGPLIAGIIRDQSDIETVFLFMAGVFAVSSFAVFILLPKRVRRLEAGSGLAQPEDEQDAPRGPAPWGTVLRNRYVQGLFAIRVAASGSLGASFSFIAVFMEEDLLVSSTMVGLALAAQQIVGGLLQPAMGVVADRIPRRPMIVAGAALLAVGALTPVLIASYWPIFFAYLIGIGAGSATVGVASRAIEVDVGRGLGMATIMSLNSTAFATGILVGSLGGGLIAEIGSTQDAFLSAFGAIVIGTLVFAWRTGSSSSAFPDELNSGENSEAG